MTLEGVVQDTLQEPLPGATAVLLNPLDSTISYYGITDHEGRFKIFRIDTGRYLLQISYLGFSTFEKDILQSGTQKEWSLDTIRMDAQNALLKEVEVVAAHIPIRIKKDTIEYNAAAFKVDENADVEALLKKLPGIEIDENGGVKAQGENVMKILVDGEEFFGNDPKIALKNLPADAVKNIQVLEDKSEQAKFTGIKDGNEQKTINITLKKDRKNGFFGKVAAGYGSSDRYNLQGTVNRFDKSNRLSLLGRINNINQSGFTFNEAISMPGGGRQSAAPGGGNGLNTNGSSGVNFNKTKRDKYKIRSSYFFNNRRAEQDGLSNKQRFFPNRTFFERDVTEKDESGGDHRLSLRYDVDLDTSQQLSFRASATIGSNSSQLFNEKNIVDTLEIPLSLAAINRQNENSQNRLSGNITYRKKFKKKGRFVTARYSINKSENNRLQTLFSDNTFFRDSGEELDTLRQRQDRLGDQSKWTASVNYSEPMWKEAYLKLSLTHTNLAGKNSNETFSLFSLENPQILERIDTLSTLFDRQYVVDKGTMSFRNDFEKFDYSIGLSAQRSALSGVVDQDAEPIENEFFNVLPNASLSWAPRNGSHLRLRYTTSVREPSLTQLQPFIDNRNPFNLYIGNPDLRTSYQQSLRLSFNSFNAQQESSYFISVNGTLVDNPILTERRVDENFITTRTPINTDQQQRISFYTNYSRPWHLLHWRLSGNANVSFSNSPVFLNTEEDVRLTRNYSIGLRLSDDQSERLNYGISWARTINQSTYQTNQEFDRGYSNDAMNGFFRLKFFKKWRLGSTMNYNIYRGDAFADVRAVPIWEASLSTTLLAGDRLHIKITAFDLLNQNQGVIRSSTLNSVEETQVNTLSRYVMFSATYSFRQFSRKK